LSWHAITAVTVLILALFFASFEALAHLIEIENEQGGIDFQKEILQFLFDFAFGFIASMLLGTIVAIGIAFLLKYIDLRKTPMLELCFYIGIMYFPYVVAEILHLSGIVSILFSGIVARQYAVPNLSETTAANADTIIRLTAHVTETIVFLELGMSIVGITGRGYFDFGFISFALMSCFIGRACNIYPITFAYNWAVSGRNKTQAANDDSKTNMMMNEDKATEMVQVGGGGSTDSDTDTDKDMDRSVSDSVEIPMEMAHMLWFVGLRGAVSYALVKTFPGPNHNTFAAATMFIVLFTTFVFGGTAELALRTNGISVGVDELKYLEQFKTSKKGWFGRTVEVKIPIGKWVLRDYKKSDPTDVEEAYYQEHVEKTESEYLAHVGATERKRKEGGIYDYGQ
jgi:NhaP-type Na+/H+ or K+/H+ antiporter